MERRFAVDRLCCYRDLLYMSRRYIVQSNAARYIPVLLEIGGVAESRQEK